MNFKERSYEPEIMDDLEMEGEEMASTLRQIAQVNKWLGGTSVVLSGLKKMIRQLPKKPQALRIIDLGCGGGEILRKIADYGRENQIKMTLIGIDANAYIVEYADELSRDYPEISYQQINIFSEEFKLLEYDIALCSLFLHHFNNEDIINLLSSLKKSAKIGLLLNDLQRSRLAYSLFALVTKVLGASKMVRHDGLLSIRKAFSKKELYQLGKTANLDQLSIQWRWAFRYQVISISAENSGNDSF